jgi:hypothetical protein
MITKVIFFILLLGGVNLAFAQLPDSADAELNLLIEDAMTTSDNQNSEQDWTILTDYLQDLRRKPINLNQASKEDLSPIPGFTDLLISRLFTHIQNFGPLTSIFELQAIEGYTPEIFTTIGPYIKVEEISKYDISNRFQHPAGPPISELVKGMKFELTQRYSTIIEEQKGYTPADTNSSGQLNTRYLGEQVRSFTRFRARYGQNFSFSLVGEKDAGEKFTWKPDNKQYGYDFVSGHIAIRNYKNLKCLTLGDYTIQYGQGLVLSGGIGFGKSSEVIMTLKRPNFGIRPYTSINEFTYYRGGAVAYAIGRMNLIGFASIRGVDANLRPVSSGDSIVTSEDLLISSLNQSGLHRTTKELAARNNITERAAGGRVEYAGKSFTIGTSFLHQEFSKPILKGTKPYQQYDFGGNANFVNGLDWDWVVRNLNLFGEVARSESGGIGATASVLAAIDPKMDVAIQVRHFDRDFHSLRASAFAERPFQPANETGIYTGIRIRPLKKFTVSTYFDKYYFPWYLSTSTYPSNGQDWLGQVNYNPTKQMEVYVRFRTERKDRNSSEIIPTQNLDFLIPFRRDNLRINFRNQISKQFRMASRIETSWYTENGKSNSRGIMFYQDLSWDVMRSIKLVGRFAIFETQDFNTRIYVYENDIPGVYSIPALSGRGSRYYAMMNFNPIKGMDIWLRYSLTYYRDRNVVSSGLEETQGPRRSDVRIQVRFVF